MTIYQRDARLYDAIYGGDDKEALSFVRWLLEHLEIDTDDNILDMGSGTGSILIPLAQDGFTIEGIEPYDTMRNYAKEKAENLGVEVKLSKGSFQELDEESRYQLVMAINGSMHYVPTEDLIDVFERLSESLVPGGYFVVDLINFYSIIKNYRVPDPVEFEIYGSQAMAIIQHDVDLDREKWINRVVLFFKDQEYQRFEDIQQMNMFSMTALDLAASNTDLNRYQEFFAYDDRPDQRVYGGRLIVVFKKTT